MPEPLSRNPVVATPSLPSPYCVRCFGSGTVASCWNEHHDWELVPCPNCDSTGVPVFSGSPCKSELYGDGGNRTHAPFLPCFDRLVGP